MPKPKSFLKEKPKKKGAAKQAPVTADDFLAAGVELEEAGEKWRAGDAVKSMRFFMRAIANYDEGLQKHPGTFDLAYNKARVQYEITQHPKLATLLTAPMGENLQVALQSHRDALHLDQNNADVLFNSGQVLTSLAESISISKRPDDEQLMQAGTYLQEAVELFQRCLIVQEMKYTQMQEEIEEMNSGNVPLAAPEAETVPQPEPPKTASDEEQEQWAMIVEPVTKNTLVETAIAQLETLTTLCSVLTSNPLVGGVGWVQEYSSELVHSRLPVYAEGSDRQYEAALARAKLICAVNELLYRGGHTDAQTYQQEVGQVFGPELDVSADPDGLCAKAEALVSLNQAFSDIPPSEDDATAQDAVALRWKHLSTALDALTAASKHPEAHNLPKIHLGRGDAEMHRWRLGRAPWNHAVAKQNGNMLLRNAQTYYRGAAALARRDGAAEEEFEGTCKEAVAAAIEGQNTKLHQLIATNSQQVVATAQDMVEDGLVDGMELSALMS
ncbi:Tetratricopeptide-like helical [Penicillium brevicompactum]|uniref:Tetratricopeptide-like helical n=1 Tax=Penicillium brevicompactum TaxID=5074 RepID=A0A9W9Q473_PENBR|nr:Tetratricopeptide-like helical [Penicillium brevicompactum]KAJ5354165.1 Tetratricopeptide-like helical [Penicillium brevicompactum]